MRLLPATYLTSHFLSLLGNSIAAIALPLIVLQNTGSALGAGAVAAATAAPAVLAGLFMGVVIDRINRRTSSVVTDLISAASLAALPVIDMVAGLNVGWFVLFGIIGSLGDIPGATARDALIPAIVRHGGVQAERLMGIREGMGAIAMLVGPAAAGTLMVMFAGPTVLWITAATSFVAAMTSLLIPHRVGAIVADDGSPAARMERGGWSQLRDGWRVLFRSRFLLTTTTVSLATVFVLSALQGLVLPVFFTQQQEPGLLGFVLTALALGMLLGSVTYAMAGTRGPRRVWLIVGLTGTTAGITLIAVLSSTWIVFLGAFIIGLSSALFGSLMGVLMIERIPEAMRGRIMGTQNAMMTIAPSLGIVLAAIFTEYVSVNAAAGMLLLVWVCTFLFSLTARSLRTLEPVKQAEAQEVSEQQ